MSSGTDSQEPRWIRIGRIVDVIGSHLRSKSRLVQYLCFVPSCLVLQVLFWFLSFWGLHQIAPSAQWTNTVGGVGVFVGAVAAGVLGYWVFLFSAKEPTCVEFSVADNHRNAACWPIAAGAEGELSLDKFYKQYFGQHQIDKVYFYNIPLDTFDVSLFETVWQNSIGKEMEKSLTEVRMILEYGATFDTWTKMVKGEALPGELNAEACEKRRIFLSVHSDKFKLVFVPPTCIEHADLHYGVYHHAKDQATTMTLARVPFARRREHSDKWRLVYYHLILEKEVTRNFFMEFEDKWETLVSELGVPIVNPSQLVGESAVVMKVKEVGVSKLKLPKRREPNSLESGTA
jgi:hypothetical protein